MIVGASGYTPGGEALRGGIPVPGALTQTTAARSHTPLLDRAGSRSRAAVPSPGELLDVFALIGVTLLGAIGLGLFGLVLGILLRGGGGRHR